MQSSSTDVFVVGAGPAGVAAALAAARAGMRVVVADGSAPPIDKACGEGLMPDSIAALAQLGVSLDGVPSAEFHGIRFVERGKVAEAKFPDGVGRGVRRTVLHPLLLEHAERAGVSFRWRTVVRSVEGDRLAMPGAEVRARWIVGADGHQSRVRRWAGLEAGKLSSQRIGLRQHFAVQPWSSFVEVYWCDKGQAYVTPVAHDEICVAFLAREKFSSVAEALAHFPELASRLAGVAASDTPRGAVSLVKQLRSVARGQVALIGDASGSVDAITGEGMAIGFRQAVALAEAMVAGDLSRYQAAHRQIGQLPRFMSQGMLMMDRQRLVRRQVLRALTRKPALFARMMQVHVGHVPLRLLGETGLLRLGAGLLTA
ncbi:MAG: FAD-dependent monooxygenase [Acidobacteriota bacterium]|nr:FAD-dependent monooxygenase [Acidobacteriota bacterium]